MKPEILIGAIFYAPYRPPYWIGSPTCSAELAPCPAISPLVRPRSPWLKYHKALNVPFPLPLPPPAVEISLQRLPRPLPRGLPAAYVGGASRRVPRGMAGRLWPRPGPVTPYP